MYGPAADSLLESRVRIPPGCDYLFLVIFVCVRLKSLRQTDHPPRLVILSVVCLSVAVKPR
jgi:hypothetical protein